MDLGSLHIDGHSLGGIETAVRVPELSLAIDVGRGRQDLLRCDHLALTHTHMDHAGGLPYLIALRALYRMRPPTVYVPAQMVKQTQAMLDAWAKMQRYPMRCELVGAEPGERIALRRDVHLVPFRTHHPVPSLGYTILRTVQKLKPELRGAGQDEIVALKRRGVAITDTHERALLSVTGDTLPIVLERAPHILESEALILECTFLDSRKDVSAAVAGGHVHLDELRPHLAAFRNETLVLSHFSQIYGPDDIGRILGSLQPQLTPTLRALATEPGGDEIPLHGAVERADP